MTTHPILNLLDNRLWSLCLSASKQRDIALTSKTTLKLKGHRCIGKLKKLEWNVTYNTCICCLITSLLLMLLLLRIPCLFSCLVTIATERRLHVVVAVVVALMSITIVARA